MQNNYSLLIVLIFVSGFKSISAQTHHYRVQGYKPAINLLWDEDEEEEDSIKGVSFGLNLGGYFASKKTANFYNGVGSTASVGQNEVQYYSIEERLNLTQQSTAQINNYFNSSSFFLPNDAYPANMRYMPAFSVGLQIKYNMSRYSAIIFNLNGIKLKANDRFTVQFQGTTAQQNGQNDVRLFNISGSEQRLNINLGYRQGWYVNDASNFYFQFGGSALGTRVQSTTIFIADNQYDLFIGALNPNQIQQFQPRTDFGLGGYASLGFEFWFKSGYSADLSFGFSRDKMVLLYLEESGWNRWLQLSFSI
ncbi:MAG: hypothetical protein ACKVOK_09830 [Flavobacteriales bacterium]